MRIVHLSFTSPRPPVSDPEKWLAKVAFVNGVAEALTAYGEQTVIYNIDFRGEINRNGVRYLFPRYRKWQLTIPFSFVRYVTSLRPDVVVVHGLVFPGQVILLRRSLGSGVKIICQHHAERPYRDVRKYLAQRADRHLDAYLFSSKEQGQVWVDAGQIDSLDKVHVVMGTSSIFSPADKSAARARLGITARKVYLWIGDLDNNKDPLLTATAFRRYAQNHKDVALYMIFQKQDLVNQLKSVIDGDPSIHLVGRVLHAKLQDWFDSADFIISSSHYEGSGIAVCEALSCGCIPIVTNIPSFGMMTDNRSLGLSFNTGNVDELTHRLETSHNMDIAVESERVVSFFVRELSFAANAEKIVDIVRSI